ncbi:glycoside hydrolase family 25 protein [Solitalea sp. MAHUQ-68]|uniref:Glycoside hydrolase family 25 protein n=1 Tax=Solitalea agri TaxID=2953739 RepID=A0A9X2F341_9SPHI|nr:glycoside hydrolase family 25 protein [Solitalea agri]MCO4293757.1 glycoside hydrolase family 25 protein [Solitalea agri]
MAKRNSSTSKAISKKTKRPQGIPIRYFWWKVSGFLLLMCFITFYSPIVKTFLSIKESVSDNFSDYRYVHIHSYGIKIPKKFKVHGIDVSKYQSRIDWDKVKNMEDEGVKINFAFIKATEGQFNIDPCFQRNWKQSKKAGLMRGAYHYFKPRKSGKWQAALFLQTVNYESGDLPPVIDIEETGRLTPEELRENLKEWLETVEKKVGEKPIIYTGYKFYEDYLKGYFDDYPYWIAHYYQSKLKIEDSTQWSFWQHSDIGKVNGIRQPVDFNVFNGSLEDLKDLCLELE